MRLVVVTLSGLLAQPAAAPVWPTDAPLSELLGAEVRLMRGDQLVARGSVAKGYDSTRFVLLIGDEGQRLYGPDDYDWIAVEEPGTPPLVELPPEGPSDRTRVRILVALGTTALLASSVAWTTSATLRSESRAQPDPAKLGAGEHALAALGLGAGLVMLGAAFGLHRASKREWDGARISPWASPRSGGLVLTGRFAP